MMKKRGSTRRQVLDIDNGSSWKNKYQSSTLEQINGRGVLPSRGDSAENPLAQLAGSYMSDSEDDEPHAKKKNIDSKVDDFLKELRQLDSSKVTDEASTSSSTVPACPWQECFDEGTGFPYYWNMVTNEVTWEIPPELAAYQAAINLQVAQSQAHAQQLSQHAKWAVEQAALGITPEAPPIHNKIMGAPPPKPSKVLEQSPLTVGKNSTGSVKKKKKGRPSSDSEEEKIEMITSWADEDSEEEEVVERKGKKIAKDKKNIKEEVKTVSKQKPPPAPAPARNPKVGKNDHVSSTIGPQLPAHLSHEAYKTSYSRSRSNLAESYNESGSKPAFQKSQRETDSRDRFSSRNRSSTRNWNGSNRNLSRGTSEERNSEEKLPSSVGKHALGKVPRGGESLIVPDKKKEKRSASDATDIIALIEMEEPPDYRRSGKSSLDSKSAAERTPQNAPPRKKSEADSHSNDKANSQTHPASFALIAGYGDDSDQEDNDSQSKSTEYKKSEKKENTFIKANMSVASEAGSKALELGIDSSRKPSSLGHAMKKRLLPSEPSDSGSLADKVTSASASYTTTWTSNTAYAMDPTSKDRRGFGFQNEISGENGASNTSKPKKGKIQFIKAETINIPQTSNPCLADEENTTEDSEKKDELPVKSSDETRQQVSSMAQVVIEKLQFLCDGKEPVSPVQALSIKLETLMAAWNAGALTQSFLQRWLQSTGAELIQLERAAAPKGWAVQWDRTYKRYFYCNLETNDTQWDYPTTQEKPKGPQSSSLPEECVDKQQSTPVPEDGDAMEICTTPPLDEGNYNKSENTPISPCAQSPEDNSRVASPPPEISAASQLISSPPNKKLKIENGDEVDSVPILENAGPPLPPMPPPPVSPPPLPSSPPPPDSPLPPGNSPSPHMTEHGEPLPPGVDTTEIPYIVVRSSVPHPSVPLPPESVHSTGVMTAIPVMTPSTFPLSFPTAVPTTYVPPPPTEAMLATYNHPVPTPVDYMGYMGVYPGPPAALPMASVVAPPLTYTGPSPLPPSHPPQQKSRQALMSELSSFYSDIATLDTNSRGAEDDESSQETSIAPVVVTSNTKVPATPSQPPAAVTDLSDTVAAVADADHTSAKKKKKPKLAPGLTLKKKGVSNLVAKWQQVQEEVWKDYQDHSDEDTG